MAAPTCSQPPHQRRLVRRALTALLVVVAVVSTGWAVFVWVAQPGAPSAFYTPPDPLPSGPPGTIIRQQPIGGIAADQRAWRVLYTSTGADGAPIAVSGVIVAPSGTPPEGGWPLLAWAHGTTGVASKCAPSIDDPHRGLDRVPELDALVAAGTIVAITDYPGLGTPGPHPYLVGESEGRSVLDSVRAARSLLGAQASTTTAVYGHSQGGHSALFADQLAASYAPELDVVGVAAMAPPTDLADLLDADVKEPAGAVLTALALTSWSRYYPDTDPATIVHGISLPLVERVGQRCIATTAQGFTDAPEIVALGVRFLSHDPATAPGWGARLTQNAPTAMSTSIPLLVSQGLTDTLVRPPVTESFVTQQCAAGVGIELDTYATAGHFQVRTVAAAPVRDWLLARLRGTPVAPGCRTVANA
jgi:alpha-beta hydrolase superfamily lysophospholipase